MALAGAVVWGIGMGAQESIMRAAVARMIPAARRGIAFGVFNLGLGVACSPGVPSWESSTITLYRAWSFSLYLLSSWQFRCFS